MESDDTTTHSDLGKREAAIKEKVADLLAVVMPDYLLEAHPHLHDTPRRMTDWLLRYSTNGTRLEDHITIFEEQSESMILEYDIPFSAICAHHFLPFHGKAAVGYIPAGKIVGLSKLARVVQFYAERITLQEHITEGIVEGLHRTLAPTFVGAYLYDVRHDCMGIRGVKLPDTKTDTIHFKGRDIFVNTFMQMVKR